MQDDAPLISFTHKALIVEARILIESTCVHCGESRLVSHADGSIYEWEHGHRCRAKASAVKTAL
jgi:hypothetical protein